MNKCNRVISSIVLVCFIFNTAVSDLAFGQSINFNTKSDKLAPPDKLDDISGLQANRIVKIKYALENYAWMLAGNDTSLDESFFRQNKEPLRLKAKAAFEAGTAKDIKMHFFFNEMPPKVFNRLCVRCDIKDEKGSDRFYVVLGLDRDGDKGFPIHVYTQNEAENTYKDLSRLARELPRRNQKDQGTLDGYEQHQKGADIVLKEAYQLGLVKEPLPDRFNHRERVIDLFRKLSINVSNPKHLTPIEDRSLRLVKMTPRIRELTAKLPKAKIRDAKGEERELIYYATSSNNTIHIFVGEKTFDILTDQNLRNIGDEEKEIACMEVAVQHNHELGVPFGMVPDEIKPYGIGEGNGYAVNEMDRRAVKLANNPKAKFKKLEVGIVDLDTNLATRDYAAGERKITPQAAAAAQATAVVTLTKGQKYSVNNVVSIRVLNVEPERALVSADWSSPGNSEDVGGTTAETNTVWAVAGQNIWLYDAGPTDMPIAKVVKIEGGKVQFAIPFAQGKQPKSGELDIDQLREMAPTAEINWLVANVIEAMPEHRQEIAKAIREALRDADIPEKLAQFDKALAAVGFDTLLGLWGQRESAKRRAQAAAVEAGVKSLVDVVTAQEGEILTLRDGYTVVVGEIMKYLAWNELTRLDINRSSGWLGGVTNIASGKNIGTGQVVKSEDVTVKILEINASKDKKHGEKGSVKLRVTYTPSLATSVSPAQTAAAAEETALQAQLRAHLGSVIAKMVPPTGGILAADESTGSAGKRLESVGLPNTPENRQAMRELMLTVPGQKEAGISAVILFDETFDNVDRRGRNLVRDHLLARGILPGIKTDRGLIPDPDSPGEMIPDPKGLEQLPRLLETYSAKGAVFTKWRVTVTIDPAKNLPTEANIRKNMVVLAMSAKMTQEAGLVPIVEPEVLLDGAHDINVSYKVTTSTLEILFEELAKAGVWMDGVILKTSMILSGNKAAICADSQTVGYATLKGLLKTVPFEVPAIVFLSGGQGDDEVNENLNGVSLARLDRFEAARNEVASELATEGKTEAAVRLRHLVQAPWQVSYSFGRGLQRPGLKVWQGKPENFEAAQEALRQAGLTTQNARLGKLHGAQMTADEKYTETIQILRDVISQLEDAPIPEFVAEETNRALEEINGLEKLLDQHKHEQALKKLAAIRDILQNKFDMIIITSKTCNYLQSEQMNDIIRMISGSVKRFEKAIQDPGKFPAPLESSGEPGNSDDVRIGHRIPRTHGIEDGRSEFLPPVTSADKTELISRISVSDSDDEMGKLAAAAILDDIQKTINEKGWALMLFASAPSQHSTWKHLIAMWKKMPAETQRHLANGIIAFHMDEYIGLPENSEQLFGKVLRERVFNVLGIRPENIYYFNDRVAYDTACALRKATDVKNEPQVKELTMKLEAETAAHARDIWDKFNSFGGRFDIVVGGIGKLPHLAFNDPPEAKFHDTQIVKIVRLTETSRQQQVDDKEFARLSDVPTHALTFSLPPILNGRHIHMMVPQGFKAEAVRQSLYGKVTESIPASGLRLPHVLPNVRIYLTKEAASLSKVAQEAARAQAAAEIAEQDNSPEAVFGPGPWKTEEDVPQSRINSKKMPGWDANTAAQATAENNNVESIAKVVAEMIRNRNLRQETASNPVHNFVIPVWVTKVSPGEERVVVDGARLELRNISSENDLERQVRDFVQEVIRRHPSLRVDSYLFTEFKKGMIAEDAAWEIGLFIRAHENIESDIAAAQAAAGREFRANEEKATIGKIRDMLISISVPESLKNDIHNILNECRTRDELIRAVARISEILRGYERNIGYGISDFKREILDVWDMKQCALAFDMFYTRITPMLSENSQLLKGSRLSAEEGRQLSEILEYLLYAAFSDMYAGKGDNPIHHHIKVLENMLEIALRNGYDYRLTRNAAVLALLHDIGSALSSGKVTAGEIASLDDLNQAIKSRKEHMEIGAIMVGGIAQKRSSLPNITIKGVSLEQKLESEYREGYLALANKHFGKELFSPADIGMVSSVIRVHDNPSIGFYLAKEIPINFKPAAVEKLPSYLFILDGTDLMRLTCDFREADRLWMLSLVGLEKDLISGNKKFISDQKKYEEKLAKGEAATAPKKPRDLKKQLDHNIQRHKEEYTLYEQAFDEATVRKQEFQEGTLYRKGAGFGIFNRLRKEAEDAVTERTTPTPPMQAAADEAKVRNVTPPAFPPQLPEGFSAGIWEWWPGNEGYAMYMIADHNTRATLKAGGIWAITGPRKSEAPKQASVVVTEFDNASTPTPELIQQSQAPAQAAEGLDIADAFKNVFLTRNQDSLKELLYRIADTVTENSLTTKEFEAIFEKLTRGERQLVLGYLKTEAALGVLLTEQVKRIDKTDSEQAMEAKMLPAMDMAVGATPIKSLEALDQEIQAAFRSAKGLLPDEQFEIVANSLKQHNHVELAEVLNRVKAQINETNPGKEIRSDVIIQAVNSQRIAIDDEGNTRPLEPMERLVVRSAFLGASEGLVDNYLERLGHDITAWLKASDYARVREQLLDSGRTHLDKASYRDYELKPPKNRDLDRELEVLRNVLCYTEDGNKFLKSQYYTSIVGVARVRFAMAFGLPMQGVEIKGSTAKAEILSKIYANPKRQDADYRNTRRSIGDRMNPEEFTVIKIRGSNEYLIIDKVNKFASYISASVARGALVTSFHIYNPPPISVDSLVRAKPSMEQTGEFNLRDETPVEPVPMRKLPVEKPEFGQTPPGMPADVSDFSARPVLAEEYSEPALLDAIMELVPVKWIDGWLSLVNFAMALVEAGVKQHIFPDENSVLIFSEKATFGEKKPDGSCEEGIGPILPSFIRSGVRVAVVAPDDKQKVLIEGLNESLRGDRRIIYADNVAEVTAKVHAARYYFLKVEGELDAGVGGVTSITIMVKKIIDAIGKIINITDAGLIEQMHKAARMFAEAA